MLAEICHNAIFSHIHLQSYLVCLLLDVYVETTSVSLLGYISDLVLK